MPEAREIPRAPESVASPELQQAIAAAKAEVTAEAANPQIQAAKETARVGLFKELWQDAIKPYYKQQLEVSWKDLKAAGMGVLSVIPILDKAAIAGREAAGAAVEISRWQRFENLVKRGVRPATRKLLHKLEPYPDVPFLVQSVGLLELFGLEFAEMVPVAWQLVQNRVDQVKSMGKANQEVTRIVFTRIKDKLEQQKGKKAAMWAKRVEEARHG